MVTIVVRGGIPRAELETLPQRVAGLLDGSDASLALCDVREAEADAVTVEALALVHLAARRRGCRVRLVHPSEDLLALMSSMGLREALRG